MELNEEEQKKWTQLMGDAIRGCINANNNLRVAKKHVIATITEYGASLESSPVDFIDGDLSISAEKAEEAALADSAIADAYRVLAVAHMARAKALESVVRLAGEMAPPLEEMQ